MLRVRVALLVFFLIAVAAARVDALALLTAPHTASQEVPANGSAETGTAPFFLNDAQTALSFTATIFKLDFSGSQTAGNGNDNLFHAYTHCCALPGTNANVIRGFFGSPFNDNTPNDFVVIRNQIFVASEPATISLLGIGLLVVGYVCRRRFRRANRIPKP